MTKSVLIIDFGSQYTHLIGRKIRELGIYAEIYPPKYLNNVTNILNMLGEDALLALVSLVIILSYLNINKD